MSDDTNKLGFWAACAYCMGGMIGSGIFLSSSSILKFAGSYGLALIVWASAGLVTILGALVYLEMGTSIPVNGGGFAYLTKARWHPIAVSFFWLGTFFTYPSSLAALAVGLADNVTTGLRGFFDFDHSLDKVITISVAGLFIVFISLLNLRKSITFQSLVTIAKIMVIASIVIIGIVYLCNGHTQAFDNIMKDSTNDPLNVVIAMYIGLFSYSGYEMLNVVMGEIRQRLFTTALAGTGTVTVALLIYLLVNMSYFTVLQKDAILESSAVSVVFFRESLPTIGKFVPFIISFLLLSNINMVVFGAGRFMAAGAKYKVLPAVIGYTDNEFNSPRLAILIQMLVAIGLTFVNNLSTLISYMSFAELLDRFIILIAFLYMRFRGFEFDPDAFHNPTIIIVIYLVICGGLLALPITRGLTAALIAISIVFAGIILYFIMSFVRSKGLLPNISEKAIPKKICSILGISERKSDESSRL